ncbi:MAG TPA: AMP-binding protein, partial [Candidatus Goldiibacteriota bacterium]|nr:AMP-binding protein [Candidatus Goldiibacteriota bacterium]
MFSHSDSSFLIMENIPLLREFAGLFSASELASIRAVFIMDGPAGEEPEGLKGRVFYYKALYAAGRDKAGDITAYYRASMSRIKDTDTASIIYTSGTSDNPKGVTLTHANFLHNVRAITPLLWINPDKGEKTVSILPSWHVYERTYEYCTAAGGVTTVYSDIKHFAEDLKNESPEIVCSVPRIWESIYDKMTSKLSSGPALKKLVFNFFLLSAMAFLSARNRLARISVIFRPDTALDRFFAAVLYAFTLPFYAISKKVFSPARELLGGKLRASFSGGGSLPYHIDLAFNAMGIRLVNAYGMTETSPGAVTRRLDRNTIGSIGIPLPETEVKVVKEDGTEAAAGEKGVLHVRGPQVMSGYYKN